MTPVELSDATYWAGFWSRIEHWMFLGVVLTLAFEFAALKFAEPYKEKLEKQREFETARLSKETETARKDTADAKLQISQANERAAQLEKEAAQARLELMELQNPRIILPDRLAAGLKGKPTAKVEVWYVSGCSDCHWLATWLAGGLLGAGWNIEQGKPLPIPTPTTPSPIDGSGGPATTKGGQPWGVSVLPADGSSAAAEALREVLLNEWKRLGGGKADDLPDGVVRIIVAPRP